MSPKKITDPIPASPQKPTSNGHYMGKNYGFNFKDGKYQIAEVVYRSMDDSLELENGLRAMITAHNEFLLLEFTRLAAERKRFWDRVADEYGIDTKSGKWQYTGDGWIEPIVEKSEGEGQ